jgi:MFS family permease
MQLSSQRLYERIVDHGDERCAGLDESACRSVPGNFFRTVLASFFSKLGDAISSPKITLAWVLGTLGAPAYLAGLLVPIRESGSLLPQLVIAGLISRLAVRKWVWVVGAMLQALAVAGMGVTALTLQGALAGWSIIGLLVVFSLARGFCSIVSKDVLGKTIPQAQRGQANGWAASAAGLATLILGVFLILSPGSGDDVNLYAGLLLFAASLWLVAAAAYGRIREPDGEREPVDNLWAAAWQRLGLLRDDRTLRRFVAARALLLCSSLSAPFYVGLAQQHNASSASMLGVFIIASGLASLFSAPFWGRFADRSSRRVMMVAAALAALLGVAVFGVAQFDQGLFGQYWFLPLLYLLLAVAHQGVRVGRKTYVVDIADGNRRTDYVAVSNTAIGAILLLTGVLSALVAMFSVPLVILGLSVMGLAGVAVAWHLPDA